MELKGYPIQQNIIDASGAAEMGSVLRFRQWQLFADGRTHVSTRSVSTWTLQQSFTPTAADENDSFGCAVALNNTAVIGAPKTGPPATIDAGFDLAPQLTELVRDKENRAVAHAAYLTRTGLRSPIPQSPWPHSPPGRS